jgi:thioredoxin-related protein
MTDKKVSKAELLLKSVLLLILLGGMILLVVSSQGGNVAGKNISQISKKDFAICLNKSGLLMYGEDTCEYCRFQKKMFGSAFESINYVNCQFDQEICQGKGIVNFPTWEKDGASKTGVMDFAQLAAWSGCPQPT